MRLIAQFEKGEELKFISHLDLMRAFQRALRRIDLKVEYSKGFNPHMETSFATALAVGASSSCEMIDIKLEEGASTEGFVEQINAALPQGLKVVRMAEVPADYPKLMAVVERASYRLSNVELFAQTVEDFFAQVHIPVMKKSKTGQKEINLREYIHDFAFDEDKKELDITLSAGQMNIRPELFVGALEQFCGLEMNLQILRTHLFASKDGQWVDLFNLQ